MATRVAARLGHDDGPFLELADAEDRRLRLVDDDRRRKQAAAHAVVRDRERAALRSAGVSASVARLFDEGAERARDAREVERARVADDGNDEPAVAERRGDRRCPCAR